MITDRAKRAAREQGSGAAQNTIAPAGLPQAEIEQVERQARLFRLVGVLAEDQRRVILLRFAEEKSIREIAQALGRSEGAIKQLQFRALQNLRAQMRAIQSEQL